MVRLLYFLRYRLGVCHQNPLGWKLDEHFDLLLHVLCIPWFHSDLLLHVYPDFIPSFSCMSILILWPAIWWWCSLSILISLSGSSHLIFGEDAPFSFLIFWPDIWWWCSLLYADRITWYLVVMLPSLSRSSDLDYGVVLPLFILISLSWSAHLGCSLLFPDLLTWYMMVMLPSLSWSYNLIHGTEKGASPPYSRSEDQNREGSITTKLQVRSLG